MNLKRLNLSIHKDNIEYWQNLRRYSYFEFMDVCTATDDIFSVTIEYDESRLPMLFSDIFHAGAMKGVDIMANINKTTDHAAI